MSSMKPFKPVGRKRAGDEIDNAPGKKSKAAKEADDDGYGGEFWELGRTRRVQFNEFMGKKLVDIREFYEKNGETLPGKKGISLNIAQFSSLIEQLPEIEKSLKAKGVSLPRPCYGDSASITSSDDKEESTSRANPDADASENADAPEAVKSGKLDQFKHKANHEATSDEDN